MAKVYILTGPIASGKTHWALERKKNKATVHLSCDDLMLNLFPVCLGSRHAQTEARCLNFLFGQAVQLYEMGLDCVIDAGFWTGKSRMDALSYFKERGIKAEIYFFECSRDIRLERLARRNQELEKTKKLAYIIDEKLFDRLDQKYEKPLPGEYHCLVKT